MNFSKMLRDDLRKMSTEELEHKRGELARKKTLASQYLENERSRVGRLLMDTRWQDWGKGVNLCEILRWETILGCIDDTLVEVEKLLGMMGRIHTMSRGST